VSAAPATSLINQNVLWRSAHDDIDGAGKTSLLQRSSYRSLQILGGAVRAEETSEQLQRH
jgi:hypothetical protein